MNAAALSKTYATVPALRPLIEKIQDGSLSVELSPLPTEMKAVYAPHKQSVEQAPDASDAILLNSTDDWSSPDLWHRSIAVHEGFHALQDLRGEHLIHRQAEAEAWTGQATYLVEELAQSSDETEWANVRNELQQLGNGELFCMALATSAGVVSEAAKPIQSLLVQEMVKSLHGVKDSLKDPASALPTALWMVYGTQDTQKILMDGIG